MWTLKFFYSIFLGLCGEQAFGIIWSAYFSTFWGMLGCALFCCIMVGFLYFFGLFLFSTIFLIFQDLFKSMITEVRRAVDNILSKPSRSSRFDFSQVSTVNCYLKRIQVKTWPAIFIIHITFLLPQKILDIFVSTSWLVLLFHHMKRLHRIFCTCWQIFCTGNVISNFILFAIFFSYFITWYKFFIPILMQYIVTDKITVGLERSLSTGNWDVKRFKMNRKGMTQVV